MGDVFNVIHDTYLLGCQCAGLDRQGCHRHWTRHVERLSNGGNSHMWFLFGSVTLTIYYLMYNKEFCPRSEDNCLNVWTTEGKAFVYF